MPLEYHCHQREKVLLQIIKLLPIIKDYGLSQRGEPSATLSLAINYLAELEIQRLEPLDAKEKRFIREQYQNAHESLCYMINNRMRRPGILTAAFYGRGQAYLALYDEAMREKENKAKEVSVYYPLSGYDTNRCQFYLVWAFASIPLSGGLATLLVLGPILTAGSGILLPILLPIITALVVTLFLLAMALNDYLTLEQHQNSRIDSFRDSLNLLSRPTQNKDNIQSLSQRIDAAVIDVEDVPVFRKAGVDTQVELRACHLIRNPHPQPFSL